MIMMINNDIFGLLLIMIKIHLVLSSAISHNQQQTKQQQYEILLNQTGSIELLLHEKYSLVVSINPPLTSINSTITTTNLNNVNVNYSDSNVIEIKFNCESSGENNFNWNSNKSNCTVVQLPAGYEYYFHNHNNNNIILILQATGQPGKQQLVAHARWLNNNNSNDDANTTNLE